MNSQLLCFTILLALVACVYTKRCHKKTDCPEGHCCIKAMHGQGHGHGHGHGHRRVCTDRMLGSPCNDRSDCSCVEGDCIKGVCTEASTTDSVSTDAPTHSPSTTQPETSEETQTSTA